MSSTELAVQQATEALWAYINGLAPEKRARAIACQRELESASDGTPDGMLKAILLGLAHNNQVLLDGIKQMLEQVASREADAVISRAMRH